MKNFLTIIISLIVVAGLLYVVIKPKADAPTTPKAVVETALIKTEAPSEQVQQKQETMKATFTPNKGPFEL
jgi:hypothetical protein